MKEMRISAAITIILIAVFVSVQYVSAEILSKSEQKALKRGMRFEKKNNFQAALKEYGNILKTNPNASEALDRTAYIYMKLGEVQKAEEAAKKAIQAGGASPVSYNIIGLMHERNNNLGYAEKYYLKAIEKDPEYASAYNNLGNLCLKRGEADESVNYYKIAIDKDNSNPLFFNNLGYAYELKGDFEEALTYYQEARKLNGGDISQKHIQRLQRKATPQKLSEENMQTLKSLCDIRLPENFYVSEYFCDLTNGSAAIWESTTDPNQRFILKELPKDNAFTDTIFSQMVFEHKEELLKMLETLSGTENMELTGQGYIPTPNKKIMYIYADCIKDNIPLEGMFCMISKKKPTKHIVILIMANKGFFKRPNAEIFIKKADKGL